MGLVRRKKVVYKKYKGKVKHYTVYELHRIYRDPQNKKKVVTKYVCYLGKKKSGPEARERIERYVRENHEFRFDVDRLLKKMQREMTKADPAALKGFNPL